MTLETPARPIPPPVDPLAQRHTKPFVEHLEDLRRTLIVCLAAAGIAMLVAVPLAPTVMRLLMAPLDAAGWNAGAVLKVIDVTGGLSLAMTIILWTGILLAAPVIVGALLHFVFPGLTPDERSACRRALVVSAGLFALGVYAGYELLLVVTLRWLLQLAGWLRLGVELIRAAEYAAFVIKLLLAFGLAFQFPVLIVLLNRVGVLGLDFLASHRRHVVVLLLIVAAVITPTVDPVTQTLLAAPLYVLYEGTLLFIRLRGPVLLEADKPAVGPDIDPLAMRDRGGPERLQ